MQEQQQRQQQEEGQRAWRRQQLRWVQVNSVVRPAAVELARPTRPGVVPASRTSSLRPQRFRPREGWWEPACVSCVQDSGPDSTAPLPLLAFSSPLPPPSPHRVAAVVDERTCVARVRHPWPVPAAWRLSGSRCAGAGRRATRVLAVRWGPQKRTQPRPANQRATPAAIGPPAKETRKTRARESAIEAG